MEEACQLQVAYEERFGWVACNLRTRDLAALNLFRIISGHHGDRQ